jgi:hypothetical protein
MSTVPETGWTLNVWPKTGAGGAGGAICVGAVELELLPGFASGWSALETLATLAAVPDAVATPTILTVAEAPSPSEPSEQLTVWPPLHEPWLVETDWNPTCDGSVSRKLTAVAWRGPLFVMTAVYVSV